MAVAHDTPTVARLVQRGPVTIAPTATLREVSETLTREEVGAALVTRGHEVIGLVSERDVVRALAEDADPDDDRVEDVMVFEVVTIDPHELIDEAAARMLDGRIRHLLVGERDQAVGVVSIRDVLAAHLGASPRTDD